MNMTDGCVIAWGTAFNLQCELSSVTGTENLTLVQRVICSNSTRRWILAQLLVAFFAVLLLNSSFLTAKGIQGSPPVLLSKNKYNQVETIGRIQISLRMKPTWRVQQANGILYNPGHGKWLGNVTVYVERESDMTAKDADEMQEDVAVHFAHFLPRIFSN